MNKLVYVTLRERPDLKINAAKWFNSKFNVPVEEYIKCFEDYINKKTNYCWFLCLDNESIVAGVGVIDNDFHLRKDLTPNICALYVVGEYRHHGIAKTLLNLVEVDMESKGILDLYLVTDHTSLYERYGYKFLTMVKEEDGIHETRIYHKHLE